MMLAAQYGSARKGSQIAPVVLRPFVEVDTKHDALLERSARIVRLVGIELLGSALAESPMDSKFHLAERPIIPRVELGSFMFK